MTINPLSVSLIFTFYLAMIFTLAWVVKRNLISQRLLTNPVIYVLALGISIQSWSFYTSVPIASARGYGYMGYYIGLSIAFLLAPVILRPILLITKTHQLSSLADLFSFRFRSPLAGILTTILLVFSILPFLAVQVSAVTASARVLLPEANTTLLAFIFCLAVVIFMFFFGASENAGRDRHQSIMTVIALETILKLSILVALTFYIIYKVFGGFSDLDEWIATIPAETNSLYTPFYETATTLVILLFFSAALAMPHMFHVTFRENSSLLNLKYASWGLPLILLIAAFPTLPILWSYMSLEPDVPMKFAALGVGMETGSAPMTLLVFFGGLSAATGVTIVSVLTIANMCLNHLIYPLCKPSSGTNLYLWLVSARRIINAVVVFLAFGIFLIIKDGSMDTDIGYLTFIACLQCLPGIITVLFWPQGNRKGFIAGLFAGLGVWSVLGLIPMFTGYVPVPLENTEYGQIDWVLIATLALIANLVTMVAVSMLSSASDDERYSGQLCSLDTLEKPRRLAIAAKNPDEFIERLGEPLGPKTATREVQRALKDLNLQKTETRPYPLQLLRDTLEANLSGLFGPTMAYQTIDRYLPYELIGESGVLDISFIESRLESFPGKLSAVAEDLDNLRRYHRQTLQDLPVGIITLNGSGKITLWNKAMETLTGIAGQQASENFPGQLPAPWANFLQEFINDDQTSFLHKKTLQLEGQVHWLNLHKARIEESPAEGLIIVLEDLTETQLLERELIHSERLASIGSLAAGVAHEIGNPVTAIACLAQNMRDEAKDDDQRLMAEKIIDQTRRTSRIVQSLVEFAHAGDKNYISAEYKKEDCELKSVIDQAIDLVTLASESDPVMFRNQCPPGKTLQVDRQRLQQVFVNLLTNARDASPGGAEILVTESSTDNEVILCVEDRGNGIPAEIRERVFEPFFTTKDPGKGTGLGLSLVFKILEDMGGKIRLQCPADEVSRIGTKVFVTFPG